MSKNLISRPAELSRQFKMLMAKNIRAIKSPSGYSTRLNVSQSYLSEIVRFKQFYQVYSTGARFQNLKDHIYHYCHDQSHFIRAFKRFTGFTPADLQNSMNEFATKHYSS